MKKLLCLLVSLLFFCAPLAACQQKPSDEARLPSETEPPAELPAEPDLTLQEDELAVYFNGTTLQCVSAEGTEFSYSIEQESTVIISDYSLVDTCYSFEKEESFKAFEDKQEKGQCLQSIFGNSAKPIRFRKLNETLPYSPPDLSFVLETADDQISFFNTISDKRLVLYWKSNGIGERYISESVDLDTLYETYFPSHWYDVIANSTDDLEIGFDGERFWCGIPGKTPFYDYSLDEIKTLNRFGGIVSSRSYFPFTKKESISAFLEMLFSDRSVYRLIRQQKENFSSFGMINMITFSTMELPDPAETKLHIIPDTGDGFSLIIGDHEIIFRTPTADYVAEASGMNELVTKYFFGYYTGDLDLPNA